MSPDLDKSMLKAVSIQKEVRHDGLNILPYTGILMEIYISDFPECDIVFRWMVFIFFFLISTQNQNCWGHLLEAPCWVPTK